jgi:hypothetical protein
MLQREPGSASPNPQEEGSPLVECPRLVIQYICSYLKAVFAILNLNMSPAAVTGAFLCLHYMYMCI